MVDVLVFDLDDTLTPEVDYVSSGFAAVDVWVMQKFGIRGFAQLAQEVFDTGPRNQVFNLVMSALGLPDDHELIREMVGVYRSHRPNIALFPDADWALRFFFGKLPLGLISDGYQITQQNKVAALGIRERFAKIVLTDELGRNCWKPSPVSFGMIEQVLGSGSRSEKFAYVGDNPTKDFIAPRKMGWRTIRVIRENGVYRGRSVAVEHDAEQMIHSLHELPEVLDT